MSGSWKVEAVGNEVLLTLAPDDEDEEKVFVLRPEGAVTLGVALIQQAQFAAEVEGEL